MTPQNAPGLWKEATQAIRANLVPGLALWVVAAAVVLSYYLWEPARPVFETLSRWKLAGGFLYSILATGLFAGLLPFAFLRLFPATRGSADVATLVFMVLFWAYRGFEVDLLYRVQGLMFGNEASVSTVAAKVAVDMFVYNVVWAASLQLLAYHWKNHGFRWSAFSGFDWKKYFFRRLPVAIVSTWVVWLPVVSLTYSLPADLQIPLFNLAACFWALVVATLTTQTLSPTP